MKSSEKIGLRPCGAFRRFLKVNRPTACTISSRVGILLTHYFSPLPLLGQAFPELGYTYLPFAIRNLQKPSAVTTLRHLLTHTSGVRDIHSNSVAGDLYTRYGDPELSLADFCRTFLPPMENSITRLPSRLHLPVRRSTTAI